MMIKFDANKFLKGKKRKPTVCYPSPLENKDMELWGYHFDETNYGDPRFQTSEVVCFSQEQAGNASPILLLG